EHFGRNHRFPQAEQIRRPTSTSMVSLEAASRSSRWAPPSCPIGKSECGAGCIFRGAAFSGRAIRAPIRVGPRAFTRKPARAVAKAQDRKSTRLNSSHLVISYAVFCLKKKNHTHRVAINSPKLLQQTHMYNYSCNLVP